MGLTHEPLQKSYSSYWSPRSYGCLLGAGFNAAAIIG
jgi:hypothetical protein